MSKIKISKNAYLIIPFLAYATYLFVLLSWNFVDKFYSSFGLYISFFDRPIEIYLGYGVQRFIIKSCEFIPMGSILLLSYLPFAVFFLFERYPRKTPGNVQKGRHVRLSEIRDPGNSDMTEYHLHISKKLNLSGNSGNGDSDIWLRILWWLLFFIALYTSLLIGTRIASEMGIHYAEGDIRNNVSSGQEITRSETTSDHKQKSCPDSNGTADGENEPCHQPFEMNKVVFLKLGKDKKDEEGREVYEKKCFRLLHMTQDGFYVYREPGQYKLIEKDTKHHDRRILNVDLRFFHASQIKEVEFGDRLVKECIGKEYPVSDTLRFKEATE